MALAAFAWASEPDGAGLEPGQLPATWLTCGPNPVSVPDWQVHEYNDNFYILRESGCTNYEKPFLYLIFGDKKALLEDTGAGPGKVQTAPIVMDLLDKWAKKTNHAPVQLLVVHSHGHGDHTAGDKQFQAIPEVEFIPPTAEAMQKLAGITNWPTDPGTIDLGGRILDVIAIPGHHAASIALYDRKTGNLLTGDSLYPGRLYVSDFDAYVASAKRLADFARTHLIAHVLGTHIEQSATPYLDYPVRTTYQPNEHRLELTRANVLELEAGFESMHGKPEKLALPEFTIQPQAPRRPAGALPPSRTDVASITFPDCDHSNICLEPAGIRAHNTRVVVRYKIGNPRGRDFPACLPPPDCHGCLLRSAFPPGFLIAYVMCGARRRAYVPDRVEASGRTYLPIQPLVQARPRVVRPPC